MRDKSAPQYRNKKIIVGFLFSIFTFGILSSFAQSLGNVAREERERQEENSRRPRVYTNEDLARPRIAGRESREEAAAAESASAVPGQAPAEQNSSLPLPIIWPKDVPLGDVARFYRKQRELESAKELEFCDPGTSRPSISISCSRLRWQVRCRISPRISKVSQTQLQVGTAG